MMGEMHKLAHQTIESFTVFKKLRIFLLDTRRSAYNNKTRKILFAMSKSDDKNVVERWLLMLMKVYLAV